MYSSSYVSNNLLFTVIQDLLVLKETKESPRYLMLPTMKRVKRVSQALTDVQACPESSEIRERGDFLGETFLHVALGLFFIYNY